MIILYIILGCVVSFISLVAGSCIMLNYISYTMLEIHPIRTRLLFVPAGILFILGIPAFIIFVIGDSVQPNKGNTTNENI